jgi:lipid II:glycine glycyltransferase (peptidoglycan interpeptide bridge formation enzyme)
VTAAAPSGAHRDDAVASTPDAPAPDAAAWDGWVERTTLGSYLQLSAWAEVKAANGWSSVQLAAGRGGSAAASTASRSIGLQVLVRRPRPMPWAFAYAPRGPVADDWSAEAIAVLTDAVRSDLAARAGRVSHLRIDPEVERDGRLDPDGALRAAFRANGWRPAAPIQPESTRVVDLRADEESLWGDLRKKWRQYVNKARTNGIRVVDADADRLGDFYRIYRETADRAGSLIRTEATYRRTFEAFAPAGRARLLFAETADGEPVATLFLLRCGTRVVEPYGGMTEAGAESRANYLLKWEAIRSSREQGAATYDLWGLAHAGIAHFKAGFGGREVRYVGAWDLVLDPVGKLAYDGAQRARVWVERRRHGLSPTGNAAAFDGDGAG